MNIAGPDETISKGDRVEILYGPYAGRAGIITVLDRVTLASRGRRCLVRLEGGEDGGRSVIAYARQLKKQPKRRAAPGTPNFGR